MRKLIILENDTKLVAENMEIETTSPTIAEHDLSSLSEADFQVVSADPQAVKVVTDKTGRLVALRRGRKTIKPKNI